MSVGPMGGSPKRPDRALTLGGGEGDEQALREMLSGIAREVLPPFNEIVTVDRQPSEFSSTYACELLTVQLSTGAQLEVFFKNFGRKRDYRYSRAEVDVARRRQREVWVYRELLSTADLGTPAYYGSLWDHERGRFWLFLEFIRGTRVKYCDLTHWVAAARWLGRMQAHFAPRVAWLEQCDCLARYDRSYFADVSGAALESVTQLSPRLSRRLSPIVAAYEAVVDVFTEGPRAFVHGEYRSHQILLDASVDPPRYAVVDWELAGLGPALFDLAQLTDGIEPPELDAFLDAYGDEAGKGPLGGVPSVGTMKKTIGCFRLHKVLTLLGKAASRGFPLEETAALVDTAERIARGVL